MCMRMQGQTNCLFWMSRQIQVSSRGDCDGAAAPILAAIAVPRVAGGRGGKLIGALHRAIQWHAQGYTVACITGMLAQSIVNT